MKNSKKNLPDGKEEIKSGKYYIGYYDGSSFSGDKQAYCLMKVYGKYKTIELIKESQNSLQKEVDELAIKYNAVVLKSF